MNYIFEHSLLNLVKNKGRNILTSLITLAIITSIVISLSIFNSSEAAINETKMALMSAVRITAQRQMTGGAITMSGNRQEQDNVPAISLEQYLYFADSIYLDGSDIRESSQSGGELDAVFYLTRPELITAFEAELRSKGLPAGYSVRTDEAMFERIISPVESLRNLSLSFLIIIISLGAVIMALLSAVTVRERKYEIGVLRAMGMKKDRVALGILTEILVITFICIIFGVMLGMVLSKPVSNTIMVNQSEAERASSTTLADRLGSIEEGRTEHIEISMNSKTFLQILLLSLILASIPGIISVRSITKAEPIKILVNRN